MIKMFNRRRFLSLPMVIGAVVIGIVSGKAIFGPPLDDYWKKKLEEETVVKENGEVPLKPDSQSGFPA